jgi:protein-tyrosine phosphatase
VNPSPRTNGAHEASASAAPASSRADSECLLFVCTGNVCRSVIAEAVFQSRADMEGWPLTASSAGLVGEGARSPRHTSAVMRRRGIDLSAHRSRRLTASMIDAATVVIGSCPEHAWAAAVLRPDASPRIFALKEIVRIGEQTRPTPGERLDSWIARVDAIRRSDASVTGREDDTIDDPKGKRRKTHERVALEIERLVLHLIDVVAPAMTTRNPLPPSLPPSLPVEVQLQEVQW